jgi:hypothetical protein
MLFLLHYPTLVRDGHPGVYFCNLQPHRLPALSPVTNEGKQSYTTEAVLIRIDRQGCITALITPLAAPIKAH